MEETEALRIWGNRVQIGNEEVKAGPGMYIFDQRHGGSWWNVGGVGWFEVGVGNFGKFLM